MLTGKPLPGAGKQLRTSRRRYGGVDLSQYGGVDLSRYRGVDLSRYRGVDLSRYGGVDLSRYGGVDLSRAQYVTVYNCREMSVACLEGLPGKTTASTLVGWTQGWTNQRPLAVKARVCM